MTNVSVYLGGFYSLLKEAFSEWNKDNASLLAAALAYYAIFSLSLLIIVIALTGILLGPQGSTGIIEKRVSDIWALRRRLRCRIR